MKTEKVIQMHSSWLAVNPIQGCPNNCAYCMLQCYEMTHTAPIKLIEAYHVIEMISRSRYYTEDIPLCFFTSTDIMATNANQEYLLQLCREILLSGLFNPIVFVTKCYIPDQIILAFHELQKSGRKVIVYLSYSGLPKTIEPSTDVVAIKNTFMRLRSAGITVIHYFRPIMPQNADEKQINEIMEFVSQYSIASVTTGLKVTKGAERIKEYWPELTGIPNLDQYECVWPTGSTEKIKYSSELYKHPIFQTNSCALAFALAEKDRYGFWQTKVCKEFNNCPKEQRERCRKQNEMQNVKVIEENLSKALKVICHPLLPYNVCDRMNNIQLIGEKISNEDICYISRMTGCRITVKGSNDSSVYWNNALCNAEPLFLG